MRMDANNLVDGAESKFLHACLVLVARSNSD